MGKLIRGARLGLMALLVALLMLFAALPASADSDRSDRGGGRHASGITWE